MYSRVPPCSRNWSMRARPCWASAAAGSRSPLRGLSLVDELEGLASGRALHTFCNKFEASSPASTSGTKAKRARLRGCFTKFGVNVVAVIANTAAAFAVWYLCLAFGVSRRVCWIAAAFSLLGFGALYTLHDVYTADPLMYVLGPVVTYQLLRERVAVAGLIAAAGVLAKEFVAAPLFMFSAAAFLERRYAFALRVLVAANTVFLVWLVLQLTLMLAFNYGYGDSASTQVMSGGVVGPWLARQSWRGALSAIFNEFGAVYILAAVGFWSAPAHLKRLGDLRDSGGPHLRLRSAARSGLVELPLPGHTAGRDCARTRARSRLPGPRWRPLRSRIFASAPRSPPCPPRGSRWRSRCSWRSPA